MREPKRGTKHLENRKTWLPGKKDVIGYWRVWRHERREDGNLGKAKIIRSGAIHYWILRQREGQCVVAAEREIKQGNFIRTNLGNENHSCNQKKNRCYDPFRRSTHALTIWDLSMGTERQSMSNVIRPQKANVNTGTPERNRSCDLALSLNCRGIAQRVKKKRGASMTAKITGSRKPCRPMRHSVLPRPRQASDSQR